MSKPKQKRCKLCEYNGFAWCRIPKKHFPDPPKTIEIGPTMEEFFEDQRVPDYEIEWLPNPFDEGDQ